MFYKAQLIKKDLVMLIISIMNRDKWMNNF